LNLNPSTLKNELGITGSTTLEETKSSFLDACLILVFIISYRGILATRREKPTQPVEDRVQQIYRLTQQSARLMREYDEKHDPAVERQLVELCNQLEEMKRNA
jgi:hypothetical protein